MILVLKVFLERVSGKRVPLRNEFLTAVQKRAENFLVQLVILELKFCLPL